jgi:hypothetical protein
LSTYLYNTYPKSSTKDLLAMILNEYVDLKNEEYNNPISNRDALLDIFTDAKVVSPVIRTARIHSKANKSSTFLYVFEHSTKHGYYSQVRIYTCTLCSIIMQSNILIWIHTFNISYIQSHFVQLCSTRYLDPYTERKFRTSWECL